MMTLLRVHLPALWPSLSVAALLVFIEALKELSATIFLRPFGLNTLSTFIYDFASRARVEETGVACLIIVLLGVVPVILVTIQYRLGVYGWLGGDALRDTSGATGNWGLMDQRLALRWVRENPADKHGKRSYSLEEFGLTEDDIRAVYGEYIEEYHEYL